MMFKQSVFTLFLVMVVLTTMAMASSPSPIERLSVNSSPMSVQQTCTASNAVKALQFWIDPELTAMKRSWFIQDDVSFTIVCKSSTAPNQISLYAKGGTFKTRHWPPSACVYNSVRKRYESTYTLSGSSLNDSPLGEYYVYIHVNYLSDADIDYTYQHATLGGCDAGLIVSANLAWHSSETYGQCKASSQAGCNVPYVQTAPPACCYSYGASTCQVTADDKCKASTKPASQTRNCIIKPACGSNQVCQTVINSFGTCVAQETCSSSGVDFWNSNFYIDPSSTTIKDIYMPVGVNHSFTVVCTKGSTAPGWIGVFERGALFAEDSLTPQACTLNSAKNRYESLYTITLAPTLDVGNYYIYIQVGTGISYDERTDFTEADASAACKAGFFTKRNFEWKEYLTGNDSTPAWDECQPSSSPAGCNVFDVRSRALACFWTVDGSTWNSIQDSFCSGIPKPTPKTENCATKPGCSNGQTCSTAIANNGQCIGQVNQYIWSYADQNGQPLYDSCQASTNPSGCNVFDIQYRHIGCFPSAGGSAVSDTLCSGSKPAQQVRNCTTKQNCPSPQICSLDTTPNGQCKAAPLTYSWVDESTEADCVLPQGASCFENKTRQTRWICQDSTGQTANDNDCSESKPASKTLACNSTGTCTYAWTEIGDDKTCTLPSGAKCDAFLTRSGEYACKNTATDSFSYDSNCIGSKPTDTITCSLRGDCSSDRTCYEHPQLTGCASTLVRDTPGGGIEACTQTIGCDEGQDCDPFTVESITINGVSWVNAGVCRQAQGSSAPATSMIVVLFLVIIAVVGM